MQDRAGIPFSHIRSNLRHENDETTRVYVHGDDNDRADVASNKYGKVKLVTSPN